MTAQGLTKSLSHDNKKKNSPKKGSPRPLPASVDPRCPGTPHKDTFVCLYVVEQIYFF
jgi:hypothetical protein